MIESVKTATELANWIVFSKDSDLVKGLFVKSKVRAEFLTCYQNHVSRKGEVISPKWENVGSGCYLCTVPSPDKL